MPIKKQKEKGEKNETNETNRKENYGISCSIMY